MVTLKLDASLLKRAACDTRFCFVSRGMRRKVIPPHFKIGKVLHSYAHQKVLGLKSDLEIVGSLLTPANIALFSSKEKLIECCLTFNISNLGHPATLLATTPDGKPIPAVEVQHKKILCADDNLTIEFYVNIDRINWDGNWVRIVDYKSTGRVENQWWQFSTLEDSYTNDIQFDIYTWWVRKYGHEFLPKDVANAAAAGRISSQVCGIMYNSSPCKWQLGRQMIMTDEKFKTFESRLMDSVEYLGTLYMNEVAARQTGYMFNLCPGCDFKGICHAEDEYSRQQAESEFETVEYEPHKFT